MGPGSDLDPTLKDVDKVGRMTHACKQKANLNVVY